jgi:hypothetical protein
MPRVRFCVRVRVRARVRVRMRVRVKVRVSALPLVDIVYYVCYYWLLIYSQLPKYQ